MGLQMDRSILRGLKHLPQSQDLTLPGPGNAEVACDGAPVTLKSVSGLR